MGEEKLIVICNYRGENVNLTEKNLSEYIADGYKKLLGNYEGIAENLRPFEVVVFKNY
ncbi:MAG: hypothetical protein IJT73_06940 [Selenomonadaceae bacterium]|nr:hypothetical protein [Selenomonadaceae bacterium]